jgi:hypothetical protein
MEKKNHTQAEGVLTISDLEREVHKLDEESNQEDFKNPLIPEEVYQNLPDFLKESCKLFPNTTDRDVFLVGVIGVLSGCLPKVYGIYDNSKVSPNLFLFIVAKAAAGKGGMKWAKEIAVPTHKHLREESRLNAEKFNSDLEEYEKDRSKQSALGLEKPVAPPNQMLFIPANSSSSVILKALSDNFGQGIIFDAEADTLSSALMQDWGNFSDLLRKAFHNETVSQLRKTNNEYHEIEEPQLSVVLSGTPEQVSKLIPDTENGLFSRFGYYNFDYTLTWKDVFKTPKQGNFNDYFRNEGDRFLQFYKHLISNATDIEFSFSDTQQVKFNEKFSYWQTELYELIGEDVVASVRRLGLIDFRIAMILTALRYVSGTIPSQIECSDIDFETALKIADILKQHATSIYQKLPKRNKKALKNQKFQIKNEGFEKIVELKSQGKSISDIALQVYGSREKKSNVQYWLRCNEQNK